MRIMAQHDVWRQVNAAPAIFWKVVCTHNARLAPNKTNNDGIGKHMKADKQ